jgi:hypothetical protein
MISTSDDLYSVFLADLSEEERNRVRSYADTRRLPTRRIGKRVLIPVADLRKYARADHPEPLAG